MNKSSILQGTMTILAFLLCSLLFVFSEVANAHDCACAVELHDVEVAINDADFTNDRDFSFLFARSVLSRQYSYPFNAFRWST